MSVLKLKDVDLNYTTSEVDINVLKNINLEIEEGEFVAIIGPSGAGKSSLLYVMSGLEKATNGEVVVDEKNIEELSDDELADFRINNFGFVFQFFNLVSVLNVEENIILPVHLKNKKTKDVKEHVEDLIQRVGLSERKKHLPSQLSGGQQQRVAIARALVNDPKIIFADEPTGNLDTKSSDEIINLLNELCHVYKKTIVMVTHNTELIAHASRVINIVDGTISQDIGLELDEKMA